MGKHRHHKHKKGHGHHEHRERRCIPNMACVRQGCCDRPNLFTVVDRRDDIARLYRDWNGWAPDYGIPGYVWPGVFAYRDGAAPFNGMVIGHQKFCCGDRRPF